MNIHFKDLILQTFKFPQKEFKAEKENLFFNGINLMELIKEYGTPLKFTYLPKISENIQSAKTWFSNSFKKHNYKGEYKYCYCTKSSHFKYILDEALKNNIHIETSSAFDINIVENLKNKGKLTNDNYIICNGYKQEKYINNIVNLINNGHHNCISILDNYDELEQLKNKINKSFKIGIRIASEEEPKFEFYTNRLGIGYKNIINFYNQEIKNKKNIELKMLHFFVDSGIKDTPYYWSELTKCLDVYVNLKKECTTLNSLNIGGGFPIKTSLDFNYDYQYIVDEIVNKISQACKLANVDTPDIFTEFGTYTVGESGGALYEVLYQKQQNDRERWNIIDSSFITTLPDTWAIKQKFIMLPINKWNNNYEKVLLGGLTCDSDDYYNSEQEKNDIYLPIYEKNKPLYIGFFNTGAYQESIGGYGGLQHCLIPQPKHIVISKDEKNKHTFSVFSDEQTEKDFLKILGY